MRVCVCVRACVRASMRLWQRVQAEGGTDGIQDIDTELFRCIIGLDRLQS